MHICCKLNEEAPTSIALAEASNLVLVCRRNQMKWNHSTQTTTSSKSLPNRSQRYPSVRGCFDGGLNESNGLRRLPADFGPPSKAPSGRQINVDRVSFDGGQGRPSEAKAKPGASTTLATFKANSYGRCFNQFDRIDNFYEATCFEGCYVRSSNGRVGFEAGTQVRFLPHVATFKAGCLTQTRMPEGFNLMSNQNQALTAPVNLVGGAFLCEPYLPLVESKPPYKGGSYV